MAQTSLQKSTFNTTEELVLYLRPSKGWSALNLIELWRYRELIFFLLWRDIKVRYKQTALGALWAIIQPFFTMIVFTIFFGRLAKVPSDNVPYPIFSYTALLPWGLFTKALSDTGRSLVANRTMITKVYFPRLSIPIASVLSGLGKWIHLYSNKCHINFTSLYSFSIDNSLRCRFVAFCPQCTLSRYKLHPPVLNSILVVYHTNCLSCQYDPGKLATFICHQPNDRCS